MIRLENYFSPETLEDFKQISKTDWYDIQNIEGKVQIEIKRKVTSFHSIQLDSRKYTTAKAVIEAGAIINIVEFLKVGRKTLLPNYEQCVALQHVEVRIRPDLYRQPFPCLAIEIPKEYRYKIHQQHGVWCPQFVTTWHHEGFLSIVACHNNPSRLTPTAYSLINTGTLEFFIERCGGNALDPNMIYTRQILRLVMNLNLLMVNYGYESKGRHRLGGKKHRDDLEIEYFNLPPQFVKLYQRKEYEPTGKEIENPGGKKPHWRKGHWRQQAIGHQWSNHKLIFIDPIFICSRLFKGDIGDTETFYDV
jgi:hypothetical protein